jgi:hypothetical protein
MADHGDDITMPACLGPQNAKAILRIMVGDALDETGKYLLRLISEGCFMVDAEESPVARVLSCARFSYSLRIFTASWKHSR